MMVKLMASFLLLLGYLSTGFSTENDETIQEAINESFLTGEVTLISKEKLEQVGVTLSSRQASSEETVIQVEFSDELIELIDSGEIEARLSIFDFSEQLVVTMPPYREKLGGFLVSSGYFFRITVASRHDFKILEKGVVYVFDYLDH